MWNWECQWHPKVRLYPTAYYLPLVGGASFMKVSQPCPNICLTLLPHSLFGSSLCMNSFIRWLLRSGSELAFGKRWGNQLIVLPSPFSQLAPNKLVNDRLNNFQFYRRKLKKNTSKVLGEATQTLLPYPYSLQWKCKKCNLSPIKNHRSVDFCSNLKF